MKPFSIALATILVLISIPVSYAEITHDLPASVFLDKCKGAWAGQMIGVCYGAPYEFRSNGKPITDDLQPWSPERIAGAIGQDDCYVEMTFLKALETHGLDITYAEAGAAFADTQYPLWHANLYGRENCRRGILPPLSGHPDFNRHADDIDFQIEADLFGIVSPGLPRESNRLCGVFGRIMNYGDGLYGGMFVAGMYSAAYLRGADEIPAIIDEGLACIPEESEYYRCIADVITWHREHPGDWMATWQRIEDKWQDDVDCMRGNDFNIDAKLNGAYIVMGLLFGEGDPVKTMEVSTRCGQDADCNPSNAMGVLGCAMGYEALGEALTGGIAAIRDEKFSHTDYSFDTLIPACQRIAESIIRRAGGTIAGDTYTIPIQSPQPPDTLEQWVHQVEALDESLPQNVVDLWNPAWRVIASGHDMDPGLRSQEFERESVLVLHPVDEQTPAAIVGSFSIPGGGSPRLVIETTSHPRGDYLLRVFINEEVKLERVIDSKGEWTNVKVDLMPYTGKDIDVRIENAANGWSFEAAYLARIEVE